MAAWWCQPVSSKSRDPVIHQPGHLLTWLPHRDSPCSIICMSPYETGSESHAMYGLGHARGQADRRLNPDRDYFVPVSDPRDESVTSPRDAYERGHDDGWHAWL